MVHGGVCSRLGTGTRTRSCPPPTVLHRPCRCRCSEGSSGFMQRPGPAHSPPRLAKPPGGARPERDAAPASHQLSLAGVAWSRPPSSLRWEPGNGGGTAPSLGLRSEASRCLPSPEERQGELTPADTSRVPGCPKARLPSRSQGPTRGLRFAATNFLSVFSSALAVSAARAPTLESHQGFCSH